MGQEILPRPTAQLTLMPGRLLVELQAGSQEKFEQGPPKVTICLAGSKLELVRGLQQRSAAIQPAVPGEVILVSQPGTGQVYSEVIEVDAPVQGGSGNSTGCPTLPTLPHLPIRSPVCTCVPALTSTA